MSQHRASFTSSRFVAPAAVTESAPTVFSTQTGWEPDNTALNSTEIGSADPSTGGYDYFASNYGSAESYHHSELHTPGQEAVTEVISTDAVPVTRRGGAHRIPTPPTALKGRAAVLAVAAGAVVAAGQAVIDHSPSTATSSEEVALAAGAAPAAPGILATTVPQAAQTAEDTSTDVTASSAPQILNVANPIDLSQFNDLLAKGQRFSEERAAREEAARRPLFVLPAMGTYTSNFGQRWGVLHAGVDIANAIGTPILAVADGTVIDSGPAAGFGMWVRIEHADGTITVYGHIDTTLVTVGQQVMAGDQIATRGNRGFSTGPHLHFEVHLPGDSKVDPLPWLASRGIGLGPELS